MVPPERRRGGAVQSLMSRQQPRAEGQRVPAATLHLLENGKVRALPTGELFDGRSVIVFGLPGAFTPTCSSQHLPRYEELAPQFRARGIDEIVCLSVNDPFVM